MRPFQNITDERQIWTNSYKNIKLKPPTKKEAHTYKHYMEPWTSKTKEIFKGARWKKRELKMEGFEISFLQDAQSSKNSGNVCWQTERTASLLNCVPWKIILIMKICLAYKDHRDKQRCAGKFRIVTTETKKTITGPRT